MNSAEVLVKFTGDTKDLDKATSNAEKSTSKLSGVIKGAFIGATTAITATATAIGKIATESVKAFAEFEQLEGGVETLFGDGAKQVLDNATQAYKTAGLGMNEYMDTVMSFSASLRQSLNGDSKAMAEYSDMAVIDMADNANKMGTSMEMIQNAYQGFAKQNYTMLDNLKLGYGGTKTEMERLIADANKVKEANGEMANLSIENFSDIVEAIHIVQNEMGITGTTSKEADQTIQGSLNSMKSAWQNVLLAFSGGGQDIGKAFDTLLETAMTFGKNLMPVLEKAIDSIVQFIPTLADTLVQELPGLLQKLIPAAINVVISLFQSLVQALPNLITVLIQGLVQLITTLAENADTLVPLLVNAILDGLLAILDNIDLLIDAGFQLLIGLGIGLIKALPSLLAKLPQIILGIVSGFLSIVGNVKDIGGQIMKGLWNGIKGLKDWVVNKVKNLGKSILNGLKGVLGIHSPSKEFAIVGRYSVLGYTEALDDMTKDVQSQVSDTFGLSPQLTNSSALHYSPNVNVINNVDVSTDPIGQTVSRIKTFSGGAKNDYNYGMGA